MVTKSDEGLNVYKEDTENIVPENVKMEVGDKVSYSQIDTYIDCPKKYEYAYVLQIPTLPHASLSFGSTIHKTLKDFYTLLQRYKEGLGITNPPTEGELIEIFNKNWISKGYENKKHEEDRKKSGIKAMKEYYKKFFSTEQNPYRLEQPFTVHLPEGSFVGKIDRIDLVKAGDIPEVEIIDYKTGHLKDEADIKNDLQLPLYCIFAEQSLGVKVKRAKYIFIEEGVEIEVDISKERREKAKESVYEIARRIKDREFTATPSSFKCKYCDFRSICKDAIL